jgi:fructose-bisphosphate aldolase class II
MRFLTLVEILRPCVGRDWAIGAYDTPNLEVTQAILDAAVADQAPVILMIYPGQPRQEGWPTLVALIRAEVERTRVPAALVLDHARTLEEVRCALDLGFSGVMVDGSLAPLEENIALTRQAVQLAHPKGISVEAELGHVGVGQDVLTEDEQQARLTRVDEAERFVEETGVDALAVSIGTAHGLYRGKPHLDLGRLAELRRVCKVPLVLHGGSDTPEQDLRRAIELGIDKINIWTDVRVAYLHALKEALAGPIEKIEVYEALMAARAAATKVVQHKHQLFGSVGRAAMFAVT